MYSNYQLKIEMKQDFIESIISFKTDLTNKSKDIKINLSFIFDLLLRHSFYVSWDVKSSEIICHLSHVTGHTQVTALAMKTNYIDLEDLNKYKIHALMNALGLKAKEAY